MYETGEVTLLFVLQFPELNVIHHSAHRMEE